MLGARERGLPMPGVEARLAATSLILRENDFAANAPQHRQSGNRRLRHHLIHEARDEECDFAGRLRITHGWVTHERVTFSSRYTYERQTSPVARVMPTSHVRLLE